MDLVTAILVFGLAITAPSADALVGYDCGGEGLNITSLSLKDIAECDVGDIEPKTEEIYLQLMQFSDFTHTEAIQCRVEIDRTIVRCGMFSHTSSLPGGKRSYLKELSEETCRKAQEAGIITVGNDIPLQELKQNSTTTRSLTLAGTLTNDGACQGSVFNDPFGTWENAIVQANVRITLRNYWIPLKATTNEVILPSGVRCTATTGECIDADGSKVFWKTIPKDNCDFDRYDILYEGIAHKLTPPPEQGGGPTIYTVTNSEATFALTKTSESNLCGYKISHTEHPRLFLLETTRGRTFKGKNSIAADNLV